MVEYTTIKLQPRMIMITANTGKIRVSELRFQCGTEDFAENEKGRKLAEAEKDCVLGHIAFWILFIAAIAAYAAFGAGWVAR
jgi:hypothetical protein